MRAYWAGLGLVAVLAFPAAADTLYLKSGEIKRTVVERFSDGAFWVKEGKRTVIVHPDEILKIVFSRGADTTAAPFHSRRPASARGSRSSARPSAAAMMSIPAADAATEEESPDAPRSAGVTPGQDSPAPAAEPDLVIVEYRAVMNSGIFQVVGQVQNLRDAEARYVKVTVFLMNEDDEVVDQNFAHVIPNPPHLEPGEKKNFKVSFLNPRGAVAKYKPRSAVSKYKIRVESSPF